MQALKRTQGVLFVKGAVSFACGVLLCLPALAAWRGLGRCEAHAFQSLYGTEDMAKLVSIERDPQSHWREREEALQAPGATITHTEFCQRFVQEAKEHIAQNCVKSKGKNLFRDGEAIDEIIQTFISEDHAIWPTTQARFYAKACDDLWRPQAHTQAFCGWEKDVSEFIEVCRSHHLTEEFNSQQRWLADSCQEFSIVDSLVMYGQGFYLSSAVDPKERAFFKAHPSATGGFLFQGWDGVIFHDAIAHALRQYYRALVLKDRHGISEQEHFKTYCHHEHIVRDDMITQSQQHLGWFYNVHELPSYNGSYHPDMLQTVLFPYTKHLTDRGLQNTVPFFVYHVDWKKDCLCRHVGAQNCASKTHAILMQWRDEHCVRG